MAHFVDGAGNRSSGYPYINLDRVAKLVPYERPDSYRMYRCLTDDGEEIGAICGVPDANVIVTNATRAVLIGFWLQRDEPVFELRYPVLAWAIPKSGGAAEPVICEGLPDVYCLEFDPAGPWIFPECASCQTVDERNAYALEALQRDEKRRKRQYEETAKTTRTTR